MWEVIYMKLNLTKTLYALSNALDTVQKEMGGISNAHGKHVAVLSYLIGEGLGYDNVKLNDLVGLAILHDNAFTEYVREEYNNGELLDYEELKNESVSKCVREGFLKEARHNVVGEDNIRLIPFSTDVKNVILYHHENANGTGPLGIKEADTPEMAQIIHIADIFDVMFDIKIMDKNLLDKAIDRIKTFEGTLFSKKMVQSFIKYITYEDIEHMQNIGEIPFLNERLTTYEKDYTDDEIKNICEFFGKIIDYKSSTTKNHSLGVAKKCIEMADYYHFSKEKRIRFYFAGAFHDIGKLMVTNDILEKPGSLTTIEYNRIKNHAYWTYKLLSDIPNIEDIRDWASRHHEKLNGSGYPFGLKESDLSFEDKLLAVIDIYQALIEKRSYKKEFNEYDTFAILRQMVKDNFIDGRIVNDLIKVYKK